MISVGLDEQSLRASVVLWLHLSALLDPLARSWCDFVLLMTRSNPFLPDLVPNTRWTQQRIDRALTA